ncbi:MAG: hypothetical protein Q8K78_09975 [Planctomycetaceae bacterium]|nr:hypothetical protein [Planctomycetaceae bacterium]
MESHRPQRETDGHRQRGERLPPEWSTETIPLWEESRIEQMFRAGARTELSRFCESHAVLLTPTEQRRIGREPSQGINHFFLRAGHPKVLAEVWDDVFIEIGRVYRFSREEDWGRQRSALAELMQGFFGTSEVRSQFGWVSLITMQRPHQLRNWEDSRVKLVRERVTLGTAQPLTQPWFCAGRHRPTDARFCFQLPGRGRKHTLRYMQQLRCVHAPAYLRQNERLIEWRYVPAIHGEHDAILQTGDTPSRVLKPSPQVPSLGTTGYLNIVMVALRQDGHCVAFNNTLTATVIVENWSK